jgi:hypothetical protein
MPDCLYPASKQSSAPKQGKIVSDIVVAPEPLLAVLFANNGSLSANNEACIDTANVLYAVN